MHIQYFYRIYPTSVTEPYRTEPSFSKIPVLLKVTFFTQRCMQRYVKKYAVTSKVTLDCKRKFDHLTDRYSYYHYRTLKKKRVTASLRLYLSVTGIVTNNMTHFFYRHL
jgi:hypothetical protein